MPFDAAYRFLRTVEHRLQLWDEQQTHTLPADDAALTRLARVLGYRDRGRSTAAEQLGANHRAHQARVRSTHEKLFFGPLLEALSGRPGPLTAGAAEDRLRAFGFLDLRATRAALRGADPRVQPDLAADGAGPPTAPGVVLRVA